MSAPAEALLQRLSGVKRTGNGRWMAKCPAHDDRGPSLAIRETEDAALLLYCFAGCETASVLESLGLSFEDLYPPRKDGGHVATRERWPFRVADAIAALQAEMVVVWVLLNDIAAGKEISAGDRRRAGLARERCQALMGALQRVR